MQAERNSSPLLFVVVRRFACFIASEQCYGPVETLLRGTHTKLNNTKLKASCCSRCFLPRQKEKKNAYCGAPLFIHPNGGRQERNVAEQVVCFFWGHFRISAWIMKMDAKWAQDRTA